MDRRRSSGLGGVDFAHGVEYERNMLEKIRELLHAFPFVPFKIRMSDGREYAVPTTDHALVAAKRAYVIVLDDLDHETRLSGLHIVGIEETVAQVK